jgi:hypothetical protein
MNPDLDEKPAFTCVWLANSKIVDQAQSRRSDRQVLESLRPRENGLPKYDEGIRVCQGRRG